MGEKIFYYYKDNDPFRPELKCNIYNKYRHKHQLEILGNLSHFYAFGLYNSQPALERKEFP